MNKIARRISTMILALATIALLSAPGFADTVYNIGIGNSALTPYTGPYATVNVHLNNSTQALITFTGLSNGGFQYLFGGTSAGDVNVNATSFTVGSFACVAYFTSCSLSSGGAGNVSTFGSFNATSNLFDGFSNSATQLTFLVNNTGGTWASDASVLKNNADGFLAAAHIFVAGATCTSDTGAPAACTTGFAANGDLPRPPVPEPASLLLMGSGLSSLGLFARRKFKN